MLKFLLLLLFLNCSSTVTIKDCCLDVPSCVEMTLMEQGYSSGDIIKVTGEGCNKVIKVRVEK